MMGCDEQVQEVEDSYARFGLCFMGLTCRRSVMDYFIITINLWIILIRILDNFFLKKRDFMHVRKSKLHCTKICSSSNCKPLKCHVNWNDTPIRKNVHVV